MTVKLNTVFSSSNKSFWKFIISAIEFWKVPETCCRSTQTAVSQTLVCTVKTNLSQAPAINNLLMYSITLQIKLANTQMKWYSLKSSNIRALLSIR